MTTPISDEYMREMLGKSREYTLVLLRKTTKRDEDGADAIIWEHGRRNFALRADGVLSIVCPIRDGSEWAGIGIFDSTPEEITKIMDSDPAVQAGILSYEVHSTRGFPGDALPG